MCSFALLDLHSLESRLREEKEEEFVLIKAKCGLINTQVQVKIFRKSEAQSRKVMHLEEMKIVFIDLKWFKRKAKV